MSHLSLTERFSKRQWSKDWISTFETAPYFGAGHSLLPSRFPEELRGRYKSICQVVEAIADHELDSPKGGTTVSQLEVHELLDSLEQWSAHPIVQSQLTWCPSFVGQANALLASAQDINTQELAMTVVLAFPEYCQNVFRMAIRNDPEFAKTCNGIDDIFKAKTPVENLVPQAPVLVEKQPVEEPVVEPDVPTKAPTPEPVLNSSPKPDVSPEDEAAKELIKTLLTLKSSSPNFQDSFVSGFRFAAKTAKMSEWDYFENHFLKALAQSKVQDCIQLTKVWPPLFKLQSRDPVEWVDRAKLWVNLRDGDPTSSTFLLKDGLKNMVDSNVWNNNIKLKMLSKMLPFTARNKTAFTNRLSFWKSLGGDLDAHCINDVNDSSLLGAKSAREWILNSNNNLWKAELEAHFPIVRVTHDRFVKRSP